jgi:hypothetical protein
MDTRLRSLGTDKFEWSIVSRGAPFGVEKVACALGVVSFVVDGVIVFLVFFVLKFIFQLFDQLFVK